MRRNTTGRPLLAAIAGALALILVVPAAGADPGEGTDGNQSAPTQAEVDAARAATSAAKRDVGAVQADLVLANQRVDNANIAAAQAAEAWNAARWKLRQARRQVKVADRRAAAASTTLKRHGRAYSDIVAASYEMSPELSAMTTMVDGTGVEDLIEKSNTTFNLNTSLDQIASSYSAALAVAELTGDQARTARDEASDLEKKASDARAETVAAQERAVSEAATVADERRRLIGELAQLQDISVGLAARRQAALEDGARRRAGQGDGVDPQDGTTSQNDPGPTHDPQPTDEPTQDPAPTEEPAPTQQPTQDPAPTEKPKQQKPQKPKPDTPPPSSSGAQHAIAYARAQLGEPYVWGGAGPNSWDCSGLVMKAWASAGKSLPHYSAGQYSASTPISSSHLQPGDLVFWGSSSSPSSIYHVAMYVGNGQIIHAPRTGRPVTQESLYYWIPPNFYARP